MIDNGGGLLIAAPGGIGATERGEKSVSLPLFLTCIVSLFSEMSLLLATLNDAHASLPTYKCYSIHPSQSNTFESVHP